MDIAAVAEHLDVEVRLVHERRIPFIKWGHLLRFDPEDIRVWPERCRIEPRRPGQLGSTVFGPFHLRLQKIARSAMGRAGGGTGVVSVVLHNAG